MTTPESSIPRIPNRPEYGPDASAPAERATWSSAQLRLAEARYYWIATTGRDGRPHSVPMWAVWIGDQLYFSSNPGTVSARNLLRNPQVIAHLEDAQAPLIVEGGAHQIEPTRLPAEVVTAYEAKYGWRMDPADPGMPFFALEPRALICWAAQDVRGTAIGFTFDSAGLGV
jgi:hypothetical protein